MFGPFPLAHYSLLCTHIFSAIFITLYHPVYLQRCWIFSLLRCNKLSKYFTIVVCSPKPNSNLLDISPLDLLEIIYMPEDSFVGVDTCEYEACDYVPGCDTATVTFHVD